MTGKYTIVKVDCAELFPRIIPKKTVKFTHSRYFMYVIVILQKNYQFWAVYFNYIDLVFYF